jgi:hypothetical protein
MTSSIRHPPNEHAPCRRRIFDELSLRPPVEQSAYHHHQLPNDPG